MLDKTTLRKPDDFHLHLREGRMLEAVLPLSTRTFARALVMPNLEKPIRNAQHAALYRKTILDKIKKQKKHDHGTFQPLMTIFLTEETTLRDFWIDDESARAPSERSVFAAKLYFASATTNANHGVKKLSRLFSLFEQMERYDIPLSIHGEEADEETDVFDREALFIDRHLTSLVSRFPNLRITFEHITTRLAVDFVRENAAHITAQKNTQKSKEESKEESKEDAARGCVAATITPHHLLLTRNDLLAGGLRPHHYCLPLLKRERDRIALLDAAASGEKNFFLGTDSAPHRRDDKQAHCGCAGIFNAPYAVECVLAACKPTTPEQWRGVERFVAENGARFHNLPLNEQRLSLELGKVPYRTSISVPEDEDIVVFTPQMSAQENELRWQIARDKTPNG